MSNSEILELVTLITNADLVVGATFAFFAFVLGFMIGRRGY